MKKIFAALLVATLAACQSLPLDKEVEKPAPVAKPAPMDNRCALASGVPAEWIPLEERYLQLTVRKEVEFHGSEAQKLGSAIVNDPTFSGGERVKAKMASIRLIVFKLYEGAKRITGFFADADRCVVMRTSFPVEVINRILKETGLGGQPI